MNIKFKGHQATEREVELSQQELHTLFEITEMTDEDKVEWECFWEN